MESLKKNLLITKRRKIEDGCQFLPTIVHEETLGCMATLKILAAEIKVTSSRPVCSVRRINMKLMILLDESPVTVTMHDVILYTNKFFFIP